MKERHDQTFFKVKLSSKRKTKITFSFLNKRQRDRKKRLTDKNDIQTDRKDRQAEKTNRTGRQIYTKDTDRHKRDTKIDRIEKMNRKLTEILERPPYIQP